MAAAAVRLLGPVEVDVDGAPITIRGERQRGLVAALALAGSRPVGAGELVSALWGDDAADHEHRLQQLVSSVRKALEPERPREVQPSVLVTKAPGYALRCDSADVEEFERAAAEAADAVASRRWSDALGDLDRALQHWRGPALADARPTPWFDAVATRLDDRRLAVHEARVDVLLALGRAPDAIAALDALVRDAPYRERLRAQLMLAYYRCDRQTDALAVFHQTRGLLVEELGVEPGPELCELEQAILRHDPALRDLPDQARDRDLDALGETFHDRDIDGAYVVRPDGQIVVLVEGSSIIGRDPGVEIQLVDGRVSRRHARIDRRDHSYCAYDLGSTNGTTVNGVQADGQTLHDGDVIGLGSIELRFHQRTQASSAAN